jgi:hypothetical protein
MADEPKGLGDAMSSLGAAITSPAKLAFAGYVILAYKGAIPAPSLCQFLVVTLTFIVLQVFHDDFLRIVLNPKAFGIAAARHWPNE